MPTCDKCHAEATIRYRLGGDKLCEPCYGPVRPPLPQVESRSSGPNGYVFKPYYSREMKAFVTSAKHEDRLLRKKGLSYIHDHKALKQEAKYILKHKEEHVRAAYAAEGLKYVPHSNTVYDEKRGRFIPRHEHR